MPCSTREGDCESINELQIKIYRLSADLARKEQLIVDLKDDNWLMQAALCGVCNELTRTGDIDRFTSGVYENAKFDLKDWFATHCKQDVGRLKKKVIADYSEDELNILRGMFKNGDI